MKIDIKKLQVFIEKRFRNKAFLVSLIALIAMVGKQSGAYEVPADINAIVDVVLNFLVIMGIVIDPSSPGVVDAPVEIPEEE